jgi:predicted Zn-dependent protease with MMP-like domain
MERAEFETLVAEALDEIPEQFAHYLQNIEVVVEDEPSEELMRNMGLSPGRDTLFGLYQGIPIDRRGFGFGNALPDKITIYLRPLVRACRTPDRVRREVRRTVIHEIGHHFGFDDRELRREGY